MHQKTAKYCLNLRGQQAQYHCSKCDKTFGEQRNLLTHEKTCVRRDTEELLIEMKQANAVLLERIKAQNETIEKLTRANEKLQNDMKEIALSKKTTTITNNNNINILPLTNEWLDEQSRYLTKYHIEAGASGFARLAKNHSFQDRVICTDPSRGSFKYNKAGITVKDSHGIVLAEKFFASIQSRNREIVKAVKEEIEEAIKSAEPSQQQDLYEKMSNFLTIDAQVSTTARGGDTDLRNEFVTELCKILPS